MSLRLSCLPTANTLRKSMFESKPRSHSCSCSKMVSFFLSVSEIAIFCFPIFHVFKLFVRLVTVLLDFSHFFTILVLSPKFFGTYFIARHSITGLNVFLPLICHMLIVLQGEELNKQWLLPFPSFNLCYSCICTM